MHHLIVLALVSAKARGSGLSIEHPIGEHGEELKKEDELVPPDPSSVCLSPDWLTRQQVYKDEQSRCEVGYRRYEKRCGLGIGDTLSVQGFGLEILKLMAAGADGAIYSTSNEGFVVKIPKSGSVCHEKAILMALAGTEGDYFPRAYEISSAMNDNCKAQILVMERVGDADWASLNFSRTAVSIEDVFTRLSAFLKAIKALHFAGFLHLDMHKGNIRIQSSDPSFIRIIDFGRSTTSAVKGSSRVTDYVRFSTNVESVLRRIREQFEIDWLMDAVVLDFADLRRRDCVDYDFWIWIFDKLQNGSSPAVREKIRSILVPTSSRGYMEVAKGRGPGVDGMYRFPRSFMLPWIPKEFRNFAPYPESSLHPKIKEIVDTQRIADSRYSDLRPFLAFDGEVIKVGPNNEEKVLFLVNKWLGSLQTDGSYAQKYQVDVRVLNFVNYRITYRVNCDDLNSNLISFQREFGLWSLGPKLGIGDGPIWLSPAVKLPKWRSAKLAFLMSKEEYLECANDPRSHVRFMVVDKPVVHSKEILSRGHLDELTNLERLRLGIEVGIDLLSKLQRLHDFGVVYGDVRPWTIAHFENNGVVQLGFTGLYRAFFDGEEGQGITDKSSDPCDLTHWSIKDNSRVGYRDDVLNVLLLSAWMLTGEDELSFSVETTRSLEEVAEWKGQAFVFDSPEKNDLISEIDRDNGVLIREALGHALDVARSVDGVDKKPDHPAIIEHLRTALNLLPVH